MILRSLLSTSSSQRKRLLKLTYAPLSSSSSPFGGLDKLGARRLAESPTHRHQRRRPISRDNSSTAAAIDSVEENPSLAELCQAVLSYPNYDDNHNNPTFTMGPIDFTIQPAGTGGHVLLGANASGKSLISSALVHHDHPSYSKRTANTDATTGSTTADKTNPYFRSGKLYTDKPWYSNTVAHVSFESHQQVLEQGNGGNTSVTKVISRGGQLSKAAQFLIVRFGLYPLLHRAVGTLSTGEIRKVMLVRALADRPRLLLLDNAFDGLDVPSREMLKDLVRRTILGFRPDILVQAVSAKDTAHTQVVLITHRPEEIVDEIQHVSIVGRTQQQSSQQNQSVLRSFPRGSLSSHELLAQALHMENQKPDEDDEKRKQIWEQPWLDDSILPSADEIRQLWQYRNSENNSGNEEPYEHEEPLGKPLVTADNLCIQRGDAVLLRDLSWQVRAGERWLVAGGNGAGKSTLSRLLARPYEPHHPNQNHYEDTESEDDSSSQSKENEEGLIIDTIAGRHRENAVDKDGSRPGVGWVSTERHMQTSKSKRTTREILTNHGDTPEHVALTVAQWMDVFNENDNNNNNSQNAIQTILDRPFFRLSQGQQKMVLLASAIASRPSVLVVDEPCQGLDLLARRRLLGMMERLCQATHVSLIYITHHLEELIPSVSHVIHLANGQAVYQGPREEYDPSAMPAPSSTK